jgi:hypothetical protein
MENIQQAKKEQDAQNKDATIKPEPETLHTTDPQRKMEGPVSSLVQGVKNAVNGNNESKKEADAKRENNM